MNKGRNPIGVQLTIPNVADNKEIYDDRVATAKGVARGENKKYKETSAIKNEIPEIDEPVKIRQGTSELLVVTKTKKLAAYVITVTEKSPKRFRAVFVNRLQNYCLDALENLIEANSLQMNNAKNIDRRKECQHTAYLKLKLLGYMAFLSLESQCILKKQYEQISLQVADCINLLVAWRKSDADRLGNKYGL